MHFFMVLIFLCMAIPTGRLNAATVSHSVSEDSAQCGICHENAEMASAAEGMYFPLQANISDICQECHESHVSNHPVEIIPSFTIPKDLPLQDGGEISCITCHNPHADRYSNHPWRASSLIGKLGGLFNRKKIYNTYFLRRNNANGDLCLACHHEEREHN